MRFSARRPASFRAPPPRQLYSLRPGALHHAGDGRAHPLGLGLHRIGGEVGVAVRRLRLGVAQQLADHGQAFAQAGGEAGSSA